MVIRELQADIEAVAENAALFLEVNFDDRAAALDFLEFHVIDRIEGLLQTTQPSAALLSLKQEAEATKQQLEAIDTALFEWIRGNIQLGRCLGSTLLDVINSYVGPGSIGSHANHVAGYDTLDVFTNGLFLDLAFPLETRELETREREPEMVYYQKTPARIIFELVAKARFTTQDVFYDLGSGLGHVAILVNLLSGVTARGVEVEPAYCAYANACAADLRLSRVTFIQADARTADYSDGTVFFLYTPFEGRLLQDVLNNLQLIAQYRPIRLFTYGPCTTHVARQHWLMSMTDDDSHPDRLGEFRSRPTH